VGWLLELVLRVDNNNNTQLYPGALQLKRLLRWPGPDPPKRTQGSNPGHHRRRKAAELPARNPARRVGLESINRPACLLLVKHLTCPTPERRSTTRMGPEPAKCAIYPRALLPQRDTPARKVPPSGSTKSTEMCRLNSATRIGDHHPTFLTTQSIAPAA
jgi:hypothetical protein